MKVCCKAMFVILAVAILARDISGHRMEANEITPNME